MTIIREIYATGLARVLDFRVRFGGVGFAPTFVFRDIRFSPLLSICPVVSPSPVAFRAGTEPDFTVRLSSTGDSAVASSSSVAVCTFAVSAPRATLRFFLGGLTGNEGSTAADGVAESFVTVFLFCSSLRF